MSVPPSLYEALPLNYDLREIRVLQFEENPDAVSVSMIKLSLDKLSLPFSKLSYCWGEPIFDRKIICNDALVKITSGLFEALQRLRKLPGLRWKTAEYGNMGLALWVDQLCIDQSNFAEKSNQVSMMSDIYGYSRVCYCYLGPETPNTNLALAYIQSRIRQHDPEQKFVGKMREDWTGWESTELCPAMHVDDDEGARALVDFSNRPYFRRGWIIQEVVVSPMTMGICGDCLFDMKGIWTAIFQAASIAEDRNLSGHTLDELRELRLPNSIKNLHELAVIRRAWEHRGQNEQWLNTAVLFDLLVASKAFEVSDPKDKIFALLSLSADQDAFPKPQYELEVKYIYLTFAEAFVKLGRGLDCIQYAGLCRKSGLTYSWVPDWMANWQLNPISLTVLERLQSGGGPTWTVQDSVRLGSAKGTVEVISQYVSTIIEVVEHAQRTEERVFNTDTEWEKLLAMKDFLHRLECKELAKSAKHAWAALYILLNEAARHYRHNPIPLISEHLIMFMKMVEAAEAGNRAVFSTNYRAQQIFQRQKNVWFSHGRHVTKVVGYFVHTCTLALTDGNLMAMVDRRACATDKLFHFKGAKALSVLRQDIENSTFRYIGNARLAPDSFSIVSPDSASMTFNFSTRPRENHPPGPSREQFETVVIT